MFKETHSARAGFTLVEAMIVIVVMGLLVALAMPAYQKLRRASAGKAMASDARDIGGAMQQIAQQFPDAVRRGVRITLLVAPDGTLSHAAVETGGDVIPENKVAEFVQNISSGTGSPITYTFGLGAGVIAFTMSHPNCAPSDVIAASSLNNSHTLGAAVAFDEEGRPL